jgi:hypothetical protein
VINGDMNQDAITMAELLEAEAELRAEGHTVVRPDFSGQHEEERQHRAKLRERDLERLHSGKIIWDRFPDARIIMPQPEFVRSDLEALTHGIPGLVGEIVEFVVLTARRPNRILALGTALTTVGTLIGRRVSGPIVIYMSSGSPPQLPVRSIRSI